MSEVTAIITRAVITLAALTSVTVGLLNGNISESAAVGILALVVDRVLVVTRDVRARNNGGGT